MNKEEDFAIRIESYEFFLDECIKHERQLKKLSDELEEPLAEMNLGIAKTISKKGIKLCEKLESLYAKFNHECDSFHTFLQNNEIKDDVVAMTYDLVGSQVRQAQKNIGEAVEEHKQLFCDIIEK